MLADANAHRSEKVQVGEEKREKVEDDEKGEVRDKEACRMRFFSHRKLH